MNIFEFKAKLAECHTELEVRRVFHWYVPYLRGTLQEIGECINAANTLADRLSLESSDSIPQVGRWESEQVRQSALPLAHFPTFPPANTSTT